MSMFLIGFLWVWSILLFGALILVVVPAGCVVLVIAAIAPWRRSRFGWQIIKLYCRGLALYVLCCLPTALAVGFGVLVRVTDSLYVYKLHAPRELAGIVFPANSKVQLQGLPPHRLQAGRLGAPTTIAGLRLVDDFVMGPGGSVESGWLVEPHQIGALPCAAGHVSHVTDTVSCELAADVRVNGLLLRAGNWALVQPSGEGRVGSVDATLAETAHVGPFACGPGRVVVSPFGEQCQLAADQIVNGYLLRGGTPVESKHMQEGDLPTGGTLVGPLEVHGVVIPAGSVIADLPGVTADALHDHDFVDNEEAIFKTPRDSTVALHGGMAQGDMQIVFRKGGILVEPGRCDGPCSFVLGSEHVTTAFFDEAFRRWNLHPPPM